MAKYMKNLDQLSEENFKLKTEISNEKQRYLDLMNAFMEVRNEQKCVTIENSEIYE